MVMGVMLLFSLPLMAQTGKEWDDVTVTQVKQGSSAYAFYSLWQ